MRSLPLTLISVALSLAGCGRSPTVVPPPTMVPDPTLPPESTTRACPSLPFHDSQRVILASVSGEYGCAQELRFLHDDGSVTLAGTFGAARATPGDCIYLSDVAVKADGDYLLAQRGTDGAMLFDRDGTLIQRFDPAAYAQPVVWTKRLWGLIEKANGATVLGGPVRGAVPVEDYRFNASLLSWLSLDDFQITPIQPSVPLGDAKLDWVQDSFAGAVTVGGQLSWVRVYPDETRVSPVPNYRGEPNVYLQQAQPGWVMLGSYEANRFWRTRIGSDEITELQQAAPPGFTQFKEGAGPNNSRLYLDLVDDGGLIDTFRNEYGAGLFRSADGAHDWVQIGKLVTQVGSVYGRGVGGSYVISSYEPSTIIPIWAPPPAGASLVVGSLNQLVRPASGVALSIPSADGITFNRTGLCAAQVPGGAATAGDLPLIDMATGLAHSVHGLPGGPIWIE